MHWLLLCVVGMAVAADPSSTGRTVEADELGGCVWFILCLPRSDVEVAVHGEATVGADGAPVHRGAHGLQYLRREHRAFSAGSARRLRGERIELVASIAYLTEKADPAPVTTSTGTSSSVGIGEDLIELGGHSDRPGVRFILADESE